jgi:hypothetical protein
MTDTTNTEARGKVVLDISMLLDGFIAGPNVGVGLPLGEGGERLHDWMSDADRVGAAQGLQHGRGGLEDEDGADVGGVKEGGKLLGTQELGELRRELNHGLCFGMVVF